MSCNVPQSGSSVLHRMDPRCRLAGLFVLIFAYSYVSDLRLLGIMLLLTLMLFFLSGLPARFILQKLKLPSIIILVLVLSLPFVSGQNILLDLGFISLKQEGLHASGLIAARFLCIISTVMIVLHTAPLLTHVKAMRAMGLPWIMADMALLTGRYLEVLGCDLRRMQTAMRLRGLHVSRPGLYMLRTRAWLCGSLLVRGLERADWVYRAMRLRGYGQGRAANPKYRATALDLAVLTAALLAAGTVIGAEIWLGL
ncbi:energy-coupling factor transporter transmembrane component T [Desulfonatronospira sp.]|uniref:energy-coupling factor transporter transmembrane component T family protein n=1 Tax=Desulfonatronospira sp. TaxID=1962951 RepID=UPI0025BBCDDC|nr:energy-coupling factor transporter transmembrane component T [Desulfonatronospira sp.]